MQLTKRARHPGEPRAGSPDQRRSCARRLLRRNASAAGAPPPARVRGRAELPRWPRACTRVSTMYRVCIALVDATCARLLTFERVTEGADTREELVERTDVANLQRRRRPV